MRTILSMDGKPPYMPNLWEIPTLSLFTGAGGLDIGFHMAGYAIVACVEINQAYCKTLEANSGAGRTLYPAPTVHCEDIRNFDPRPYKGVECIIGGPPCQTFSAAGRRSGGVLGTSDDRGKLFIQYCEILQILNPRVFIFENVYGLPGANNGSAWREIVNSFSALGYSLKAEIIDAADYGVPQHRERLFLVGYKHGDFTFPLPTHGHDSDTKEPLLSSYNAIRHLQDLDEPYHPGLGGLYGHLLPKIPEGLNYSFFTKEMGHPEPVFAWRSKFHDLLYKVDPHSPTRTIKAQPGKFTGPFHWKNRHFSIDELKALQTFPYDYEIIGSYGKVVEQIGNSVPPRLAHTLAITVREQVLRPEKIATFSIRPPSFKSTFRKRQRERSAHFKSVALAAIRERYGSGMIPNVKSKKRELVYKIVSDGKFDHRRLKTSNRDIHGERSGNGFRSFVFRVEEHGSSADFFVQRLGVQEKNLRVSNIVVDGLSKFVDNFDRLDVRANIQDELDLFPVWMEIENYLTTRSRFFTLIDIYGHYANRGDTVHIAAIYEFKSNGVFTKLLNHFGNSSNCGAFIPEEELRRIIHASEEEILESGLMLRHLRFDFRTNKTHATIDYGKVLCTYPFPLLSKKAHLE